MRSSRRAAVWLTIWALTAAGPAAQDVQDQAPRFRSSVEVTSVDVTVVDDRGRPVLGLQPEDFSVRIDGTDRQVVSVQWVPLSAPAGPKPPPLPEGYSSNEGSTAGRLILLVIDQPNIRFGGVNAVARAIGGFIDRLQPTDRVAAVGISAGSPSVPFTSDHERVKQAVLRMPGGRTALSNFHNIALSEAMSIRRGDGATYERVMLRECGDPSNAQSRSEADRIMMCRASAETEAQTIALTGAVEGGQTINTLRSLLTDLRHIDAPKTLVLVSEGFVMEDDQQSTLFEIGSIAAASKTSIYALKLDSDVFDMSRQQRPTARFEDRIETSQGIEVLTNAARGSLFRVVASADPIFERIESELSGYYLLGVESGSADKDGKPHPIDVRVNRRGADVRHRRQLTADLGGGPRTPREAMMAALTSPLTVSALPLRVATFALQGPEPSKVQLLIHADVGLSYSAPAVVSIGYVIANAAGTIVDSQTASARLPPIMNGVPSPLQFTGGASLPPGDYTLKLSVAESDLVGTVEHQVRATLLNAGGATFSELMVGGPVSPTPGPRPSVGHTVNFGNVQGYLEVYGEAARRAAVTFEIAEDIDGPAILSQEVPPQPAGDARAIFSRVIPVRQLPRGPYVLRAVVSSDALPKSPVAFTRAFEVAPPSVLMTSIENAPPPALGPSDLFLPVGDELFARAFRREDVIGRPVLEAFRQRVAPAQVAAFDRGAALLTAGEYGRAETSFKATIQPDTDSTAGLAYLGATFAASGHDSEAAGAWQTALIEGADVPEIYQWLGDALMRNKDLTQARAVLEEATGKWPSDPRFAEPLALLYATFGQGREAVRTLQRHLERYPDDVPALALGVEWIYQLHTLGVPAISAADDVRLAQTYAAAYEKAKGPQRELVKQWLDAIQGR